MTIKHVDIKPIDLICVHKILNNHLTIDTKVWVFGSRATGTTKKSSDLDLAIDAGRPLTHQERIALAEAFDESDLPYTVDVVDMQTVSKGFKAIIEQTMVALQRNREGHV